MTLDSTGSTEIGLQLFTSSISPALWRAVTLALFQRLGKVPDESDRSISFAIDGASSVMTRRKRAQLIPPIPVALLAGIFNKYAFIISAVIGGIVNCDSEGGLSLTNCLSLSSSTFRV